MATPTPEVLPPAEVITDTDKGGLITVVNALFLSFIIITLFIRVYIRIAINGPWKQDDNFLAAATAVATLQSVAVFLQVRQGYGKTGADLSIPDFEHIGKTVYAGNVLFLVALLLSKCAVVCLFLRLTKDRWERGVSMATAVVSLVWLVASILLITIHCSPAHPWNYFNEQCSGFFVRWQVITAFHIITEAALFLTPVYLVYALQMRKRSKAVVLIAFGLRLPVIAASVLRLRYLNREVDSSDPTLYGAYTSVWTQVELDYSIISSTISCLGPFISPFEKANGAATGYSSSPSNPASDASKPLSVECELSQVPAKSHPSRGEMNGTTTYASAGESDISTLPQDSYPHASSTGHGMRAPSGDSRVSHESQRHIVKTVEYSLEHGQRPADEVIF